MVERQLRLGCGGLRSRLGLAREDEGQYEQSGHHGQRHDGTLRRRSASALEARGLYRLGVANAALASITALGRGKKLPMLVEIGGVTHSAAARKVFPDPSTISRMALLGSSPVDRVIAMFRLTLVQAGFPIRYFTSEDKAVAWLLGGPDMEGTKLGN